jgi:hypothetical protein
LPSLAIAILHAISYLQLQLLLLPLQWPSSLPTSLVFVAIDLFVAIAVCSPATLVAVTVALPPSLSSSPVALIAITITLATIALFVAALIISCTLSSFVVARHPGRVVVDALSPATACL